MATSRNTVLSHSSGDMAPAEVVQPRKMRRLKEKLFLKEMERLADEMCQETMQGGKPVQVSTRDIRSHLDIIQHHIHDAIADATKAPSPSTNPRGDSRGTGPLPQLAPGDTHIGSIASGLQGAQSITVQSRGEEEFSWRPEVVTTLSSRLRTLPQPSGFQQLPERKRKDEYLESPMLKIRHFRTDDAKQMALLDINMDGNTHCLSARGRRNLDPVHESMKEKLKQKHIPAPPPPPQSVQAIVNNTKGIRPSSDRMSSHSGSSFRPKAVGPWSARDAAATMASLRSSQRGPNTQLQLLSLRKDPLGR